MTEKRDTSKLFAPAQTITPDEVLSLDEFMKVVNSYETSIDAIYDGVGITHSFPPENIAAQWEMTIFMLRKEERRKNND